MFSYVSQFDVTLIDYKYHYVKHVTSSQIVYNIFWIFFGYNLDI